MLCDHEVWRGWRSRAVVTVVDGLRKQGVMKTKRRENWS